MARANNPTLGNIECNECGDLCTVHQRKGKAKGYLYTHCPNCGCDQKNGVPVQTRLFYESEWLGDPPERPPNVPEKAPAVPAVKPNLEPKKPAQDTEDKPKGGHLWLLVPLGIVAAAILPRIRG
jgi:hypothetical protein